MRIALNSKSLSIKTFDSVEQLPEEGRPADQITTVKSDVAVTVCIILVYDYESLK